MEAWWNSLSILQQITFVIGCATTLFMIVQIVMMLIGLGGESDFDGDGAPDDLEVEGVDLDGDGIPDDFDGDGIPDDLDGDGIPDSQELHGVGFSMFGLKIFSVKSILAFFSIGSWVTFTISFAKLYWLWALLVGVVAGMLAAVGMAAIMKGLYKLQDKGNIDLNNCVGLVGEVYLTVPPTRSGEGKVNVTVQERFSEFAAVTDSAAEIATGAKIKVVSVAGNGVIVVEPLPPESAEEKS